MSNNEEAVREAIDEYIESISSSLSHEGEYNISLLHNGRGFSLSIVRGEDDEEIKVSSHIWTDAFEIFSLLTRRELPMLSPKCELCSRVGLTKAATGRTDGFRTK